MGGTVGVSVWGRGRRSPPPSLPPPPHPSSPFPFLAVLPGGLALSGCDARGGVEPAARPPSGDDARSHPAAPEPAPRPSVGPRVGACERERRARSRRPASNVTIVQLGGQGRRRRARAAGGRGVSNCRAAARRGVGGRQAVRASLGVLFIHSSSHPAGQPLRRRRVLSPAWETEAQPESQVWSQIVGPPLPSWILSAPGDWGGSPRMLPAFSFFNPQLSKDMLRGLGV